MKAFLLFLLVLFLLVGAALYFGQGRLIYFPRGYSPKAPALKKLDMVSYESGGKKQWSYLYPKSQDAPPTRVWWLFGGNGSVALNWLDMVEAVDPEISQAFVLFDYPGYGFNRGHPSPETIQASVDASIPHIAEHLKLSPKELMGRSHALAHSLGCAVALDTAQRYEMKTVVAISPFTTMEAMARRQMGGFVAAILRHQYDNETSLDLLLAQQPAPEIYIFHGEVDNLIPIEMSRSLLARDKSGKSIQFEPVPRAGHNNIIGRIELKLIEILEK